jgi:hypothetical protein
MSYDVNACQGIFYCDEEQTIMKESERKRETIGVQVDSELWKQVRIKAIKEKRTAEGILNDVLVEYLKKKKK